MKKKTRFRFRCCQPCMERQEGVRCSTLDNKIITDMKDFPPLWYDEESKTGCMCVAEGSKVVGPMGVFKAGTKCEKCGHEELLSFDNCYREVVCVCGAMGCTFHRTVFIEDFLKEIGAIKEDVDS